MVRAALWYCHPPLCHTSQEAVPMSVYRTGQTTPNTQPGGFQEGCLKYWYLRLRKWKLGKIQGDSTEPSCVLLQIESTDSQRFQPALTHQCLTSCCMFLLRSVELTSGTAIDTAWKTKFVVARSVLGDRQAFVVHSMQRETQHASRMSPRKVRCPSLYLFEMLQMK